METLDESSYMAAKNLNDGNSSSNSPRIDPSSAFSPLPGLTIRCFEEEDEASVRKLIFAHIRSQIHPAVRFWIFRNLTHLLAMMFIVLFFVSILQLFLIIGLVYIYLTVRSWYEFEMHIRRNCDDLVHIRRKYMSDPQKMFWVAEFDASVARNRFNTLNLPSSPACSKEIVGCIGIGPMKEDPQRICQVFRLVVSPSQRRLRVGTFLLQTLEEYARQQNFIEVRMIANNLIPEVHKFYMRNSYEVLYVAPRALMRGDLVAYRKRLNPYLYSSVLPKEFIKENNINVINDKRDNIQSNKHLPETPLIPKRAQDTFQESDILREGQV